MLKSLSLCALILVLATGLIHADVYRCKDANGTLIFTDAPSSFPPECQVKVIKDLPLINVVPSTLSKPARQRKTILPPASTDGVKSQEKVESEYSSLKEEAEALVGEFHSTRSRIFNAPNQLKKYKARKDLIEIQSQKGSLLSEVDQSTLKRRQKKEVKEILTSITE